MAMGSLGRVYAAGEAIIHAGEVGDCMYVIQDGEVEVMALRNGSEVRLNVLRSGDFFGEMALFNKEVRSATVRALGQARVLTVTKANLLKRIHADPSLAFRMLETMSRRIRDMSAEVTRLQVAKGAPPHH